MQIFEVSQRIRKILGNILPEALEFFEKALKLRLAQKVPQDQIDSTELAIKVTKARLKI